jgi:hypothetical protein
MGIELLIRTDTITLVGSTATISSVCIIDLLISNLHNYV